MNVSANEHDSGSTGSVKTVIVPAAGRGTRFLPTTKAVPKELLPVVDTPGIGLIADEAADLGADRLAVVIAPGKEAVLDYFQRDDELEAVLEKTGKKRQLAAVKHAAETIDVVSVIQEKALGLGHAVGMAEEILADDEDVVGVLLPDDLVLPTGAMNRMAQVRKEFGGSVLCAFTVAEDDVSKYGVFAVEDADGSGDSNDDVKRVTGMVEKPAKEDAPSRLAAAGRYLLDREIFDALGRITPGAGGELQLTDAIELLISEGHPVHVIVHHGRRHDLGTPAGFIPAVVDFGLSDPDYGASLLSDLKEIIHQHDAGVVDETNR